MAALPIVTPFYKSTNNRLSFLIGIVIFSMNSTFKVSLIFLKTAQEYWLMIPVISFCLGLMGGVNGTPINFEGVSLSRTKH
jgi:hypothetical protein